MSFWESVETYQVPWADESEYFSPLKCCGRWGIEQENNFLSAQQRVWDMLGVHSRSPKSYSCILMTSCVSKTSPCCDARSVHSDSTALENTVFWSSQPDHRGQSVKLDLLCMTILIGYGQEPFQSRDTEQAPNCGYSPFTPFANLTPV